MLRFCLTQREKEYLSLAKEDLPDKQIAMKMCVSIHTVETHRNNCRKKLHTSTKLGSVIKAIRAKYISL